MVELARFVRNVLSRNEDRRLAAANVLVGRLLRNYRLTWHQLDWFADEEFSQYLQRFGEGRGFNSHRRWTLWQLLRLVTGVDGDTAECGVYEGASSWLICAANRDRAESYRHHLFDSFEGLSSPDPIDGSYWSPGSLASGEATVLNNLAAFAERLEFHKGWIPQRFPDVADKSFSFVHVDVDLYRPTLDSLAFFYERLNPGGILVCDDYAFGSCPGATAAVDEFLSSKPEKMLLLDAGGGFFIKGMRTAEAASVYPASELEPAASGRR